MLVLVRGTWQYCTTRDVDEFITHTPRQIEIDRMGKAEFLDKSNRDVAKYMMENTASWKL